MRKSALILSIFILFGCLPISPSSMSGEDKTRDYASSATTLSDFSMKIVAYYRSRNLSVPADFDGQKFFALLEKIYPDQSGVNAIRNNYRVAARPIDGGYSVMLCDPKTNQKIMEDLSCHLDRVEMLPFQTNPGGKCVFESNWQSYCE